MFRSCSILLVICGSYTVALAQFKPNVAAHLKECNTARLFKEQGHLDSAIRHYELALKYFEDNSSEWVALATLYEKKKRYKDAEKAYSIAVSKGSFPSVGIDSEFPNDKSPLAMQPFVKRLDTLTGAYYTKTYDWELGNLLKQLQGIDQFARNLYDVLVPSDTVMFNRLLWLADSINRSRLLAYFDSHGFPKSSSLDDAGASHLWLIIHHNLQWSDTIAAVARLDKYTRDAVYNGDYNVRGYVMTLDYQYMGIASKQFYGMYKRRNEKQEFSYSPIDSLQGVDKRRAQWLLPSLAEEQISSDLHPIPPSDYNVLTQER